MLRRNNESLSFKSRILFLFFTELSSLYPLNRFLNELDKMPPSATQIQQMPTEADQSEGISSQTETKKEQ